MTSGTSDAPPRYAEKPAASQSSKPRDPLWQHAQSSSGLPAGLFMLRNEATGRMLDVRGGLNEPGSEICLFQRKPPTPDENGDYMHPKSNQIWFIDSDAHLCSAAALLHVAVANGELYLASLQPILPSTAADASRGFPPRFRLDPQTSTLHVLPCLTDDDDMDVLVEAVPKRKAAGEDGWTAVTDFLSQPFGALGIVGGRKKAEPEIHAEDEDDDSSDGMRALRTVALAPSWRDKVPTAVFRGDVAAPGGNAEIRRWKRRQWTAIPIGVERSPVNERVLFSAHDEQDAREL